MALPPIEARYFPLPTAEWKPSQDLAIDNAHAVYTGENSACITNSTSRYPVIGTVGVSGCIAVILYDRANKTAAIGHYNNWTPKYMEDLIGLFPQNVTLEAHLVGATPVYSTEDVMNQYNKKVILETLEAYPRRIAVKTFDIYPKPRPRDIGIDSGTGQLIMGSKLCEQGERPDWIKPDNTMMLSWTHMRLIDPAPTQVGLGFDGRMREHQMYPDLAHENSASLQH